MLTLITNSRRIDEVIDERSHLMAATEALLHTRPVPLDEVTHAGPGCYVLLYSGDLPQYSRLRRPCGRLDRRPIVSGGGAGIYCGSAVSIAERIRTRHLRNLQGIVDLEPGEFSAVVLGTKTHAGALYLEGLLATNVLWNQSWLRGFGSKAQGQTREAGQKTSMWNMLHPGRRVAPSAPKPNVDLDRLRHRIVSHLEDTVSAVHSVAMDNELLGVHLPPVQEWDNGRSLR